MSSDSLFFTLPQVTQNRIDSAFKSVTSDTVNSAKALAGGFVREQEFEGGFVRDEEQAGGFIRDDVSPGGGFIRDEEKDLNAPTHIPLSEIPSALQALDLPPDDHEVLAVFRNAATGWTSSSNKIETRELEDGEQFVSKDDWRSVCAVLLEHDSGGDVEMADLSGDSDDEYQESEDEEGDGDEGDNDEYIEGPSKSTARRRTRQSLRKSSSLSPPPSPSSPNSKDSKQRKLTSRQREACIDAYALFFPSIPIEELHAQRIMIKDIQRVAKLLNEKLKAEEMVEMLETFSTSPDKSMNFDDFCRMMVKAKLA
ncbi:hypothetical protein AGABI1DRAFT_132064 [Agaricus bisporus var. burnettii JB137-S8]|uniref:EF-hand domain-containing protein n=1 Tax=Agaricus bisporus var. burnettii (strain JB137-S8 / ATCC MYA-4627 / FGSC 10392) TaxID=597362 RepID=K5WYJ8_AGABU|nr:uncharacterized protein AGABI1DRAFT_132064 [Agaricus bisporus var. burnettii JB137-S8]EKM75672.1 hypothetical protein AGABI1DRAFT_132064 [Agaricus bisporus var. burnettii JB137-S8]